MKLFLLSCLMGVALAQNPPVKCCVDRQFEVTMGEVAGSMFYKNGHYVQNFIQGYNRVYFDYHNEDLAVDAVITEGGVTTNTHIVMDYHTSKMYVQYENGSCTTFDMAGRIQARCIPDDAVFDGYHYMGYGTQELELVSWRYREPGTDHIDRMTVTKEGCIPVSLARVGHFLANNTLSSDVFYLYTNFSPSISKKNVFRRPSGCSKGTGFIPVPVGRSLDSLSPYHR